MIAVKLKDYRLGFLSIGGDKMINQYHGIHAISEVMHYKEEFL